MLIYVVTVGGYDWSEPIAVLETTDEVDELVIKVQKSADKSYGNAMTIDVYCFGIGNHYTYDNDTMKGFWERDSGFDSWSGGWYPTY